MEAMEEAKSADPSLPPSSITVNSKSSVYPDQPSTLGRLSTDPDGSIFVACDDAGVEFVHAVAPGLSSADVAVRNSNLPDVVQELFLLHGVVGFDGCSYPLAAVQVTELAKGVFFDGVSLQNFIRAWSELCRGVEKIISWPPDDAIIENCKIII